MFDGGIEVDAPMFTLDELREAHGLVQQVLRPTPALAWPLLARRLGAEVVVKHENHQPTGAFKVRGGLTYCDALRRREPEARGIISATRGNHGQSLAFAGRRFGFPVTIVVPHGNSREKNAAMRALGAELIEHGADFQAAREEAMRLAEARGLQRRAVVPPRPRARRRDLRSRAPRRVERPRRRSMSRSGRGREYAAQSPLATRWG